jgi:methionyl aminopeptidase
VNEQYKKNFIEAGLRAKETRAYGKALIKPGVSYNEVVQKINKKIEELGARPAFPPQIALNEVAAHFLPHPEEDIVFSNEVVKLDVGVCYNGAIGDCAVTIDLSGKNQKLIDAAEAALANAEQHIAVGLPIRTIGKVIEDTITSYGFSPVKNLSGHGLGFYKIHTPPSIPNYDDNSRGVIKPGMTFAIEPFATNGKGFIYEAGAPRIFSFIKHRPAKSTIARLIQTKIKDFTGLPFSLHNLMEPSIPFHEIEQGIAELLHLGVIEGYAPLIEEAAGLVAQAENSVLVDRDGKVLITTR